MGHATLGGEIAPALTRARRADHSMGGHKMAVAGAIAPKARLSSDEHRGFAKCAVFFFLSPGRGEPRPSADIFSRADHMEAEAAEHPLLAYIRESELGADLKLETPFGSRPVRRPRTAPKPGARASPPHRSCTPTTPRAAARYRSSKTTCGARSCRPTATRTHWPPRPVHTDPRTRRPQPGPLTCW